MRISDWSSDVCSSDLAPDGIGDRAEEQLAEHHAEDEERDDELRILGLGDGQGGADVAQRRQHGVDAERRQRGRQREQRDELGQAERWLDRLGHRCRGYGGREAQSRGAPAPRSEEHTSELQSLMRISYAVFCLKKKKTKE